MRYSTRRVILSFIAAFAFGVPVLAGSPPNTTPEGLVRVPDAKATIAYVRPNTDWSKYKSVTIQALVIPTKVRDTAPRSTRPGFGETYILRDKDVAAIQKLYYDAVSRAFRDNGFQVTDNAGPGTLIIASEMLNITLKAPIEETRQNYMAGRTYSEGGFGSMMIATALGDGETNTVVAELADRHYSNELWGSNTRASNTAEAKTAFGRWGRDIATALRRRTTAPAAR